MLDSLISLVAPHSCVGCGAQGAVVCGGCLAAFTSMPDVCYRCGSVSAHSVTCTKCKRASDITSVRVVAKYEGIVKDVIWKLKFSGARAAAKDMARAMTPLVDFSDNVMVVHVPTATSRIRTRGYDQAQLLAREIARHAHALYCPALVRTDQQRQVGSSRKQRFEHLRHSFRLARRAKVVNAHILLVDDVLTTGATLEAAASVLKKAGAKRVDAVVFARA